MTFIVNDIGVWAVDCDRQVAAPGRERDVVPIGIFMLIS